MIIRPLVAIAVLLFSASASAAPPAADLTTSITASASPALVYGAVRYTVTVRNVGNRNASNVVVRATLPATATSPQVYVLGSLGQRSPGATLAGTTLSRSVGTLSPNGTQTLYFDLALPVTTQTPTLGGTATTSSAERSTTNNGSTLAVDQSYYQAPVGVSQTQSVTMENQHCTGTNLSAWFECTLFPSSISSFQTVLAFDGSLSIPLDSSYTGRWELASTPDGNELWFEIKDSVGDVMATFSGWGADAACFEGVTTFPGSTYVAPYRVCPTP
jgi:uncharacterized repeat protein (TIGR01451 family)